MAATACQERAVLTANQYSQGNIAGLSDYMTRRLVASTVLTESNGGDLAIKNKEGYFGRYQAGASWLADAGLVDRTKLREAMAGYSSEWKWAKTGGMTKFLEDPANWKGGLNLDTFKQSPELQDQAFKTNSDAAYRQAIRDNHLKEGDSEEHIAGFLKARHIAGYGGAVAVIEKADSRADANGTTNFDYYNDIAINRDGLNQILVVEDRFKGIPYKLPIERELRPGDANLAVRALQENLKLAGVLDAQGRTLDADGDYGKRTREAVSTYQNLNDLPVTGSADIATLTALRRHAEAVIAAQDINKIGQQFQSPGYRNDWMQTDQNGLPNYLHANAHSGKPHAYHAPQVRGPLSDDALKIGERGPEVAKLQESLIHLGINDHLKQPIKADGVFGPETERAVQAFQLWHGADHVNGVADRQTLAAINTQAGLAIVQRTADQVQAAPARDFVANVNIAARVDPSAAADPRDASQTPPPNVAAPAPGQTTPRAPEPAPVAPTAGSSAAPAKAELVVDAVRLSPGDQAMFTKIRENVAAHVPDETVAVAMLAAKRNGITDAESIGPVGVANGKLWVGAHTPGFHTGVSLSEPLPAMQDTLRETQAFNQQRDQQLTQEAAQRNPDDPNRGPRM